MSMPPHGLRTAMVKALPSGPSIPPTIPSILGIPGIMNAPLNPRSSATRVALRFSVPRRYSTCTVSPGSTFRASSISFMPGPESSSFSAATPASAVPLNFVMTSPTLIPASSAGPPGVTPSMRAPTLSPVASARVSTTTPIRPRFSLYAKTLPGPVSTRTRGCVLGRRGVPCGDAAAGIIRTASAATVNVRIISPPGSRLEPDIASAGHVNADQLAHEPDALLPQFDEFSVLVTFCPLRQGAVAYGNAVFQIGNRGRRMTAQHATVGIDLFQTIFERRRLLVRLAQLGIDGVRRRRLHQQHGCDRGGEGETAGPRAPGAAAARAFRAQRRFDDGPAIARRVQGRKRLELRDTLIESLELRLTVRAGGDVAARPDRRLTCPQGSQIFHRAVHYVCAP